MHEPSQMPLPASQGWSHHCHSPGSFNTIGKLYDVNLALCKTMTIAIYILSNLVFLTHGRACFAPQIFTKSQVKFSRHLMEATLLTVDMPRTEQDPKPSNYSYAYNSTKPLKPLNPQIYHGRVCVQDMEFDVATGYDSQSMYRGSSPSPPGSPTSGSPSGRPPRSPSRSPYRWDPNGLSAENTNFAVAKRQFEDAGYALPRIVFWDLADRDCYGSGTASTPVTTMVRATDIGFRAVRQLIPCQALRPRIWQFVTAARTTQRP